MAFSCSLVYGILTFIEFQLELLIWCMETCVMCSQAWAFRFSFLLRSEVYGKEIYTGICLFKKFVSHKLVNTVSYRLCMFLHCCQQARVCSYTMLGYRLTSRTTPLVWASPRWLVPSLQQGEHCRPLSGCYSRKAQASNKHYRWMVSGFNTRLLSLSGSKLLDQDVCGSWKPKTFSSHHCAFSTRSNPKDAESDGKGLSLRLGERHVQVPLLWLRDHCRCQSCYNSSTFQKNVDTYSLDNLALLETNVEGDALSIKCKRWRESLWDTEAESLCEQVCLKRQRLSIQIGGNVCACKCVWERETQRERWRVCQTKMEVGFL